MTVAVDQGALLGIREAAARTGASERALRYYEELGLVAPSARTPGGMRRYSEANLSRITRIREMQSLLGFNLDEIKAVFATDDRLEHLRTIYRSENPTGRRRRELLEEAIRLRSQLADTVRAKMAALDEMLKEENANLERLRGLLAEARAEAESS